jgi:hypothetical protein
MKPYIKPKDYSIRDKDGKWLNSDVFRQEALRFKKNGYYCAEPPGSSGFKEYWDEQLRRCIHGYEVGGWKITGHHYGYLNFAPIMLLDKKSKYSRAGKKILTLPDFWDGDYNYFWSIEIAKNGVANEDSQLTEQWQRDVLFLKSPEEQKACWLELVEDLGLFVKPHPDCLDGGYHFLTGKSRRKGYSYKNGWICANVYNTTRKALTLIGAFDKKYLYPEGTMGMASNYLSHLNKHTAWAKAREYVDKQDIKRASFEEKNPDTGVKTEAGYLSTIMAITFGDNQDAARGKDALYVLFEEMGKFPNARASWNATAPGLTAGDYITGQILGFGTGGDMESGTVDFAYMFYNPFEFRIMPFLNIWDEEAGDTYCGFFHPVYWNMEGYYDSQGNSDFEGAIARQKEIREELKRNAGSSLALQEWVQEWPFCPSEAFLLVSINDFPVAELQAQKNRVMRDNLHIKLGQPCVLVRESVKSGEDPNDVGYVRNGNMYQSKVRAIPDLGGELQPIWDYKLKDKNTKGAVVIYEYPIPGAPKGLYKIGYDPYRQDKSQSKQLSLASIYVYKGIHKYSDKRDCLVAQYVGRPGMPDDANRIAEMLAELYGAEIMHENEVTHVKSYFEKKKKLYLLAAQPDAVISANVKNSGVARVYGMHMIEKLKDAGEKYLKQWLLTERDVDEDGNKILNLETIYDPALLEELILYNRKGNFDRVMAFMMLMFQIEEEGEAKEYGSTDNENSNATDLLELMSRQFSKS